MRKRELALLAVALILFVVLLSRPSAQVSEESYSRIEKGMSREEVAAVRR
jgi:hypothetical protein